MLSMSVTFTKECNQVYKPNMESRETFFAWLNQTRVRSSLKPTIPKPFRLRTKERSDLRASNAEKRANQVKRKADSLQIERLPNSSEAVGSHLKKESDASVSMDVIPSETRVPEPECKVHTLEIELNAFSAQLSFFQKDITCMIAEISMLKLRLQNMEQQMHLQRDLFSALHAAMWDKHLESEMGQALPNPKSTVCSDISINSGCEPVAAGANPRSAATPVRADSQRRTSIDLLNFISLKSFGGISLIEEGLGDFEFIMNSAINCSFDGSHVPEAWNCITPTGIIIDGGPNRTPSNNEGEIWPKEGTGLSTNRVRNSSPMSLTLNAKSAAPAKDDSVLKSDGATPLPIHLNSMETSDELSRSMILDEGSESKRTRRSRIFGEPLCNGSIF